MQDLRTLAIFVKVAEREALCEPLPISALRSPGLAMLSAG